MGVNLKPLFQRVQGIAWGDQVRDSSLYFDGHTLVVDVIGTGAGLPALKVRAINPADNAPTDVWTVNKDGGFTLDGLQSFTDKVRVGDSGYVTTPGTLQKLLVGDDRAGANDPFVLGDFVLDSASTGSSDQGALRAVFRQSTSGTATGRAFEAHAVRSGTASAVSLLGVEVGVHSDVVGNGTTTNVGIYCSSHHAGWTNGAGSRADTALLVLGADGWSHAIRYLDTNNATLLFDVDQSGNVVANGKVTLVGGTLAIQATARSQTGLLLNGTLTGSTSAEGLNASPTYGSGVTSVGVGLQTKITTQAASFTMVNAIGYQVVGPTLGASSAITTITGIQIANQGATGVTNAIGLDIAAQSGASSANIGLRNAGTTQLQGATTIASATATPAGGSTSARLLFGTTAGFGIYYGSGAPTVGAAQGSVYLRSDGSSSSTRVYVNSDGGTGWVAITTAS